MKYSDLKLRIDNELWKSGNKDSYNDILLRVIAPLLSDTDPPKASGFVYLHCPMCGYQDCQRPEKGYCCRKCGESVKPSRLNRVPVMDLSENQSEMVIQLLICFGMISPLQKEWAKAYLKRDSEAFWNYVKLSTKP